LSELSGLFTHNSIKHPNQPQRNGIGYRVFYVVFYQKYIWHTGDLFRAFAAATNFNNQFSVNFKIGSFGLTEMMQHFQLVVYEVSTYETNLRLIFVQCMHHVGIVLKHFDKRCRSYRKAAFKPVEQNFLKELYFKTLHTWMCKIKKKCRSW
jgi:hypothetical protein